MFETRVEKKNTLNEKRFPFSIELSEVIEWGEIKQSNKNIYIYNKDDESEMSDKKKASKQMAVIRLFYRSMSGVLSCFFVFYISI